MMKNAYLMRESPKLRKIARESYKSFMAALRAEKPRAKELIENDAMSQAHDAYVLIRSGQIKLEWVEGDDGRYVVLTVVE